METTLQPEMTTSRKTRILYTLSSLGVTIPVEAVSGIIMFYIVDVSPVVSLTKKEIAPKLTNILFKLAFRRKLLPDVRNRKGQISTEVSLLKIGSLWLATVPGELLPKLGLSLKDSMRQAGAGTAGVIGLANDELGYILPKEDFRYPLNPLNPGRHYEETMSVGREIGPLVVEAIQSLMV